MLFGAPKRPLTDSSREKENVSEQDVAGHALESMEADVVKRLVQDLPLSRISPHAFPLLTSFLRPLFSAWMEPCREELKRRFADKADRFQQKDLFIYGELLQHLCHRPPHTTEGEDDLHWKTDTRHLDVYIEEVFQAFRMMLTQHPDWVQRVDRLAMTKGVSWSTFACASQTHIVMNALRGFLRKRVSSPEEATLLGVLPVRSDRGTLLMIPKNASREERAYFESEARSAYVFGEDTRVQYETLCEEEREEERKQASILSSLQEEIRRGAFVKHVMSNMYPMVARLGQEGAELCRRIIHLEEMKQGARTEEERTRIDVSIVGLKEQKQVCMNTLYQAKRFQKAIDQSFALGFVMRDQRFTQPDEGVSPQAFLDAYKTWMRDERHQNL